MSYYVTTPIYYVNSTPHVGHAYTTIAADVLARHYRQRGEDVFFLTGVDEHASKVARVAAEQGLDPQEYADRIVGDWRELPELLHATNDFFIRTSDKGHKEFVQGFLQRIYDAGDVYQGVYAGWYCVGCEAFKTESELVDGKCPIHETTPEWIEEKNWFFRLSSYQDRLLELYDARPDFVLPAFRYNEARSFIAGGLQDFSISRAGQPWGVSIPWDPEQVAYVWADALVNYLSALFYAPGDELYGRFWQSVRHLIGKDIIRFHCVYWPAMLLSAGYEVPHQLFVHGWLLLDDRKISKSLGNVVDPLDLLDVYGADAVRFWSIRSVSFGQDGSVSLESLHERYERELANDLGNLVSRTTAMLARYGDGELADRSEAGAPAVPELADLRADVASRLDAYDLTGGLERIWEGVRALNRHVETQAPWKLAKEGRDDELEKTLYDLTDGLRVVAVALASYLPETSARILEAIGEDAAAISWDRVECGLTTPRSGIAPAPPLFPRIDAPTAAA